MLAYPQRVADELERDILTHHLRALEQGVDQPVVLHGDQSSPGHIYLDGLGHFKYLDEYVDIFSRS